MILFVFVKMIRILFFHKMFTRKWCQNLAQKKNYAKAKVNQEKHGNW